MVVLLLSVGIVSTLLIYHRAFKNQQGELHKFRSLRNLDIVVAQDGTGDFMMLPAAVTGAPSLSKNVFCYTHQSWCVQGESEGVQMPETATLAFPHLFILQWVRRRPTLSMKLRHSSNLRYFLRCLQNACMLELSQQVPSDMSYSSWDFNGRVAGNYGYKKLIITVSAEELVQQNTANGRPWFPPFLLPASSEAAEAEEICVICQDQLAGTSEEDDIDIELQCSHIFPSRFQKPGGAPTENEN